MREPSMFDWLDIMVATSPFTWRDSKSSSALRMRFTMRLSRSFTGSE